MNLKKLLKLRPKKVARRVAEYVVFASMWRGSDAPQPAIHLLVEGPEGEGEWRVRASVTNTCICQIYVIGVFLRKDRAFRLAAETRSGTLKTSRPFGRSSVLTATTRLESLAVGRTLTDQFAIERKDPASRALPGPNDFFALYRRHDDKERIRLQTVSLTVQPSRPRDVAERPLTA